MKKFTIFTAFVLFGQLSFGQEVCYGDAMEHNNPLPDIYFDGSCWKIDFTGNHPTAIPSAANTAKYRMPEEVGRMTYENRTDGDVIGIFHSYDMPCGNRVLGAFFPPEIWWPEYLMDYMTINCTTGQWEVQPGLSVNSIPWGDQLNQEKNNYVYPVGPHSRKDLATYFFKDQCTPPPTDLTIGTTVQDCTEPNDYVLDVNGTFYPSPFLGVPGTPHQGGIMYITSIPSNNIPTPTVANPNPQGVLAIHVNGKKMDFYNY